MLPPPESSKSRHSKQLKPPEDSFTTTAINSSSNTIENTNVNHKAKVTSSNDEKWLDASDVMKLGGKSSQITATAASIAGNENNRNGIKLSSTSVASPTGEGNSGGGGGTDDNLLQAAAVTTTTSSSTITAAAAAAATAASLSSSSSSSAAHYIDAFSDLDPLGTGKIRPYIDKKYFFQDLKNPPKKVLKDLSDRDGFSTSFSSDQRNAAATEFSMFHDKSLIDNTQSQKQNEQSDEFVAQFVAPCTQIFSPNNNGTHGTPPNLSRSSESSKNY